MRSATCGARSPITHRLFVFALVGLALAFPAPALAASGAGNGGGSASQIERLGTQLVLATGSGYGTLHGSAIVRAAQRRLARAGYAPGPIDGRYGTLTWLAVVAFQRAHRLQVDGIVGPRTSAALNRSKVVLGEGAADQAGASGRVRTLQRRLALAGDTPGPVDGRYGPLTAGAVRRFQAAHGLAATGTASPQTLARVLGPASGARSSSSKPRVQHSRRPSRTAVSPRQNTTRRIRHSPPTTRAAKPRSHPSGSSTALLAILAALGVTLVLAALMVARRRRRKTPAGASASAPSPPPGLPPPPASTPSAVSPPNGHSVATPPPVAATETNGTNGHDVRNGEFAVVGGADAGRGRAEAAGPDAERMFARGVQLEQQGELREAVAAFTRADDQGHAGAAASLGMLLEDQGEREGAEAAYRRADQRGDAFGAFRLGLMLVDEGALSEAEDACRRADDRGHAGGASNLGVLLEGRGALAEAEAAYRRAHQRGEAAGSYNLGVLLEERGALAEAEDAYRRADRDGEGEVAESAHAALRALSGQTRERSLNGSA